MMMVVSVQKGPRKAEVAICGIPTVRHQMGVVCAPC
jgi:hypothetical protein